MRWLVVTLPFLLLGGLSAQAAEVRVLGASSLTDALAECSRAFERSSNFRAPILGFASSSKIARQIQAGAHADVVITADDAWMDVLSASGDLAAHTRRPLLRNELALVVPKEGWLPPAPPALNDSRLQHLAIAGEAVPAGRRAREVLAYHHLLAPLRNRMVIASSARSTLALVARNEVDAAVVYRSDALSSDRVRIGFVFPSDQHGPILYPVALTPTGRNNPAAVAFYDFLRSEQASAIFRAAGFSPVRPALPPATAAEWRGQASLDQGGWGPIALSLWVGALSVLLSLLPGVGLGYLLARRDFFGKTAVTLLAMSPLVLPPVVTGFLLLQLFGRNGVFAPLLQPLGIDLAFTRWGAVIAAAVVGFPLLVQLVRQAFEAVDPRYEQVAQTLGRSPLSAFFSITLPLALPGITAGAVLAFTRALGEFGATAVLAGDVPGETRTLALALFAHYETPGQEAAANQLVLVSIGLCAVSLLAYELLTRAQRRRLEL